jgi:hypothetical protein
MTPHTTKRAAALLGALFLSLAVAACGNTVSTSSYKGESHKVAEAISNFQSDATAADQQKLCQNDLARPVLARLKAAGGDCQQVLKSQLQQVDNFNVNLGSITVKGETATAQVKSIYSGKSRLSTITLLKEGKTWKIASVG